MDRNQIDRGSLGFRLRSRSTAQGPTSTRVREEWSGRCEPETRAANQALRGAEYRRFCREVERDLDPRGPLERIVTRQATRAAWVLQSSLGGGASAANHFSSQTSSAARTLKISITTLDLLQGRRVRLTDEVPTSESSFRAGEAEEAVLLSNEWPSLPPTDEPAQTAAEFADEDDRPDEVPIWRGRLVFDFEVSDESPVVRGTWITVSHVVSLIVDGATWADILRSHPELTEEDIRVCVAYAVAEDDADL